jgi:hypothetical protein
MDGAELIGKTPANRVNRTHCQPRANRVKMVCRVIKRQFTEVYPTRLSAAINSAHRAAVSQALATKSA